MGEARVKLEDRALSIGSIELLGEARRVHMPSRKGIRERIKIFPTRNIAHFPRGVRICLDNLILFARKKVRKCNFFSDR